MLFLILSLLWTSSASAASPGPKVKDYGISLISLCGPYDPVSRALTILPNTKVILASDYAGPEATGFFCFRGRDLAIGGSHDATWLFHAEGSSPASEEINFPVLFCATVNAELATRWNGELLQFRGPALKSHARSPHGWCGDGSKLPRLEKNRWVIDFDRFREAPDHNKRSGMSIGNQ